jgi:hypothetical protein
MNQRFLPYSRQLCAFRSAPTVSGQQVISHPSNGSVGAFGKVSMGILSSPRQVYNLQLKTKALMQQSVSHATEDSETSLLRPQPLETPPYRADVFLGDSQIEKEISKGFFQSIPNNTSQIYIHIRGQYVPATREKGYDRIDAANVPPEIRYNYEAELPRQANQIFNHAKLAIAHARTSIPQKSNNKDYGEDDSRIPQTKLAKYSEYARTKRSFFSCEIQDEIDELRDSWKAKGQAPDLKQLAKIIYNYGQEAAGNCEEYAIVAYDYLSVNLNGALLDIVKLKDPGDHAFVVINQPKNDNGSYPKCFSEWDENAYIVDPWVKIACPAREYPKEWETKMHKWEARGLKINDCSPLSNEWLNTINDNEKISIT